MGIAVIPLEKPAIIPLEIPELFLYTVETMELPQILNLSMVNKKVYENSYNFLNWKEKVEDVLEINLSNRSLTISQKNIDIALQILGTNSETREKMRGLFTRDAKGEPDPARYLKAMFLLNNHLTPVVKHRSIRHPFGKRMILEIESFNQAKDIARQRGTRKVLEIAYPGRQKGSIFSKKEMKKMIKEKTPREAFNTIVRRYNDFIMDPDNNDFDDIRQVRQDWIKTLNEREELTDELLEKVHMYTANARNLVVIRASFLKLRLDEEGV